MKTAHNMIEIKNIFSIAEEGSTYFSDGGGLLSIPLQETVGSVKSAQHFLNNSMTCSHLSS